MNNQTFLTQIYAKIPSANCQGLCAESCGPILMSGYEWERIEREMLAGEPNGLTCTWLHEDRCSVYDVRPLICRLWGVTESMSCPFGCVPDRILSDAEARVLIDAVKQRMGVSKKAERLVQFQILSATAGRVWPLVCKNPVVYPCYRPIACGRVTIKRNQKMKRALAWLRRP